MALVKELEERIQEAPTVIQKTPSAPLDISLVSLDPTTPRSGTLAGLAGTPPRTRSPTQVLTELGLHGAAVFRDLGVFGEPPATDDGLPRARAGPPGHRGDRRRAPRLGPALPHPQPDAADAAPRAQRPRRGGRGPRLLPRRCLPRLRPRRRERPSVGHGPGTGAALPPAPRGGCGVRGLLPRRRDAGERGPRLEPQAVAPGRGPRGRGPARAAPAARGGDGDGVRRGRLEAGHGPREPPAPAPRRADGAARVDAPRPRGAREPHGPGPGPAPLAVCSHDKTLRLFDVEERAQVFSVPGHRSRHTTSLAFFRDGTHLATVAQDNAVQLWDIEKRATIAALWGQGDESFAGDRPLRRRRPHRRRADRRPHPPLGPRGVIARVASRRLAGPRPRRLAPRIGDVEEAYADLLETSDCLGILKAGGVRPPCGEGDAVVRRRAQRDEGTAGSRGDRPRRPCRPKIAAPPT